MTKAMRWGVSSLMIVGGIALGAFAGCSDDEETPTPVDTDSGVDTGSAADTAVDTAPVDTSAPDTTPPDAGPFVPDRAVTLLFGSPDLAPKFVCLGAFSPTADPAAADAPASFQPGAGALGVPTTADLDPTKTVGLPYGAVVPVPLNPDAVAALKVFKVVLYLLDENPAKMTPASTCGAEWKKVKGDTKKWKAFDPNSVKAGEHALLSLIGCNGGPDATGTCGTAGNNFEFRLDKLDVAKPTTPADATIGFQFMHLSQFPGSTASGAPSWQGVDIYLMPMPAPAAPGDAGTDATSVDAPLDVATDAATDAAPPAPIFIKIADNVSYKSLTATAMGVKLPSFASGPDSYLVVAPRVVSGASVACSNLDGKPSTTCPNYTLPLKPFLNTTTGPYPKVGGGFVASTNQVIGLIGSGVAPAVDGGTGVPSLRIPFIKASPLPGKTW